MRRWRRPGWAVDQETVLHLSLTNREFESNAGLTVGSSLDYEHSRKLHFDGHLDSKTWLVVDKFEEPPVSVDMPWPCWVNSFQMRQPKASIHITERCVDSSMDPEKGWFFTLTYDGEATYSGITYPESLDLGLIVEPAMFSELLNADLSHLALTTSLWLSDQFESFREWDEIAGMVIGWDVSKGKTIRLDKYSISIKTKAIGTEPT